MRHLRSKIIFSLALSVTGLLALPSLAQTYNLNDGHQATNPTYGNDQYQRLPTYNYDPALDPKKLPKPPKPVTVHSDKDLLTQSGIDLGAQISGYQYEEPSLGVKLSGPKFGLHALVTGVSETHWFLTGDIRGAFGFSDYQGSGTQSGNFEYLWDVRGLVGKDLVFNNWSVTPFSGFGFRYLNSDDRGTTSTGAAGYRRDNMLYYLPIGAEERFRATDTARIALNLEYDYVISGQQTSTLSDANAGLPDVTNNQKSGYGFRGNIMWEEPNWAIGPFFNYWHIEQSDTVCASGPTLGLCGYEPTNHTFEGGLEVRYHIY